MKFSTKVFIYIFISTAVIITGMTVLTYSWTKKHHLADNIQYQRELVTLVALKSEEYILRSDLVELYNFYQSIVRVDPFVDYIFAENQNGVLVYTFEKGVPKGLLNIDSAEDPSGIDITPIRNNQGELIYHFRVGVGDPVHATVHCGVSVTKIHADLAAYRKMALKVGGVLLLFFPFGVAIFLSRLISRPLKILRKGVGRIGGGELGFRLDMPPGDEIHQLATDINTMAERLGKLRDGLQAEISEHKQTERALKHQSGLLDNVLNNIPHNVFWKDRKSEFLGCNRVFAETAGLEEPGEIVGKSDYDLPWKPSETEFFIRCDRVVMTSELPMHDVEETLVRADGTERTIITSKVPLRDSEGIVYGVLGIFYDITERKLMEEALKQSQKMEAIGTLAGGIAHDFNNILGSIYGYTELAMDATDKGSETFEFLEQVLKSSQRAKELIRQILTFSRKSQEERKPLFMAGIIKEEAKLLRSTLPTTIEIRQKIDPDAGMVNADLTQMHQVVMNLCTNAAYAMRENGGGLEIYLAPVEMTQESVKKYQGLSPGPFVALKVSDTGVGIDPHILHRIFEPFFTTKSKERGTGMGLAVVHGIVRDHGGDIVVESQLGRGTTFTVLLPQIVSGVEIDDREFDTVLTGDERILFVDDEKSLLDMMENLLISLGYEVTPMSSSLEALEAYRKCPDAFDIVITDHTMPHMTGYQMALRMLETNPAVAIILCTGYSETITPEKVAEAGIKSLLYKPIEKIEIARAIREALDPEDSGTAFETA